MTAVAPCAPHVESGALPTWMRAGFGPGTRVTHAIAERGSIGAVLWNKPLYAPPAQHVNNKILWVPRHLSKSVARFAPPQIADLGLDWAKLEWQRSDKKRSDKDGAWCGWRG